MNINSAFPSKFLKESDLDEQGELVTIKGVKIEKVGSDNDQKPVVYFSEKDKGLVLNKTNSKKIMSIAGSAETDGWKGVKIVIFPTETEFAGETVGCIRVRAPKGTRTVEREPQRQSAPPDDDAPITDEDVPF